MSIHEQDQLVLVAAASTPTAGVVDAAFAATGRATLAFIPPGAELHDTFTDASGTALNDHTGEIGASWSRSSFDEGGTAPVITSAGRLRVTQGSEQVSGWLASAVPSQADYRITGQLYFAISSDLHENEIQLVARWNDAETKGISAGYDLHGAGALSPGWFLFENQVQLDRFEESVTVGQTYEAVLEVIGTTARLLVNGVEKCSATVIATAAGQVGVLWYIGSGTPSDSNGIHLDAISMAPVVSGEILDASFAATGMGTVAAAGALVAAGAVAPSGAGTATLAGATQSAGSLAITGAATLATAAVLDAAGTLVPAGTGTLAVAGTLHASSSIAASAAGASDAVGVLDAAFALAVDGVGALDLVGDLDEGAQTAFLLDTLDPGDWLNELESPTDLHLSLNEPEPDDDTYIRSPTLPSESAALFAFAPLSRPEAGPGVLTIRHRQVP